MSYFFQKVNQSNRFLLITEMSFLIYHFLNVLVEFVNYKSTNTTNASFIQISITLSTKSSSIQKRSANITSRRFTEKCTWT